MKKMIAALSVPTMVVGLTALTAVPARAHTPAISADCDGVRVAGTAYDGNQSNRWSVTIDGVTRSGTFGSSLDQTFPVPQGGATSTWSALVEGWDGSYRGEDAGTVGPCGTPPPVDVCPELDGDQPDGTACTPPPAERQESSSTRLDCDDEVWVTESVVTTTAYVYDEQTNTWVPGQPVSETTVEESPVEPGDCTVPEVEGVRAAVLPQPAAAPPAVATPPPAAVPTVVNAGLAPTAPEKQAVARFEGGALALLLGAGLVLAGGVVRRRTR